MTPKEYNKCVDDCADALYRFALKIMRISHAAEDVVQEAFEKLWEHRAEVEASKAKSWLFTVAHNCMMDAKRKHKIEEKYVGEIYDEGFEPENFDLNELLHRAVDRLPDVQKAVLLLRDYEGYSYEEIEKITGLGVSQVKVYIYRARLKMKEYIGSMDVVI